MKRFYLTLSAILLALTASAQDSILLTTKDGLCSSEPMALHIDSNGDLWIGTRNGLNKYDGFQMKVYYSDPSSDNSLLNDVVQVFTEDDARNIYIGTTGGLCSYNMDTHAFHAIPLREGAQPNVSGIIKRKNGDILVSTHGYGGLYKVIKDQGEPVGGEQFIWTDDPNTHEINTIFEDSDGTLWISARYSGLFALDQTGTLTKFLSVNDELKAMDFTSISQDMDGTVYLASQSLGVLVRKRGRNELSQLLPDDVISMKVASVSSHEGDVFISTEFGGLYVYDTAKDILESHSVETEDGKIVENQVNDIVFDGDENVIFALNDKGILINRSAKSPLKTAGSGLPGAKTGLYNGEGPVTAIHVNKQNQIWVGTEFDGLYLLDADMSVLKHYDTMSSVLSVYEDAEGTVWYGEKRVGLFRIKSDGNKPERFFLTDNGSEGEKAINNVIEDSRGELWVCSAGEGVYVIDRNRTSVRTIPLGDDNYETRLTDDVLENKWVNCMATSKGKVYFGTYNGICCYNTRTESFLENFPNANHLLDGTVVNDICEDLKGDLWLATTTGLVHLNMSTFEPNTYTYNDGLPQNNISSVNVDTRGRIWTGTSIGLSFLDISKGKFTQVRSNEALSNEFSVKSKGELSSDGTLIFGSKGGITWFDPDKIEVSSEEHPIFVYGPYFDDELCSNLISGDGIFRLKHKENSFSLVFSTGSFMENTNASFSYSLDNGRVEHLPKGSNKVTFNKLTTGKYNLSVYCNSIENNYTTKDLKLIVSPAWYASLPATLFYLLLIGGLIAYLYYIEEKKSKREAEEQQEKHEIEMNEAKLQYFFNLAHEIRTPMSLIISPLSKLIATDNDPDRQAQYGMMSNNAKRITLLINQIMDIRRIEKGKLKLVFRQTDINQYLMPIAEVMNQTAKQKGINFSFIPSGTNPEVWIDAQQFDKIVMNIIENAIKYTPEGGDVILSAETSGDNLKISVTDNGIGIDEDKLDTIFERYYQAGRDSSSTGFGIGLNLVQSLVRMHHGTVKAFNNKNGIGSCFEVEIPLGNGHLSEEETTTDVTVKDPSQYTLSLYETFSLPAAGPAKVSKTKDNVAIVEDNPEVRQYLEEELSSDYNVTVYEDGQAALDGILKSRPDIVVSDIIMPRMDGFQLCSKIKKNIITNAIPVILLTGKNEETDRIIGLEAGADAYISKPFNIVLLKKNFEQLLENLDRLRNIYIGRQDSRIEDVPEPKNPDEQLMERINKALNANIRNQDLNVETLAQEIGISRVHLYRKLTELTNQSPSEFIRNSRLAMAAEMLKDKRIDISTVASEAGFSSISVFSRNFKLLYGITPSEYQAREK
ncbi:MAG: response regulator [Bacteroidia bacterium]|nr:response regulator [Bacteroidia bacterium]